MKNLLSVGIVPASKFIGSYKLSFETFAHISSKFLLFANKLLIISASIGFWLSSEVKVLKNHSGVKFGIIPAFTVFQRFDNAVFKILLHFYKI
ncbi:MAG: hypothetical protein NC191_03720 [Muribaculaceae bacterium]|nr:hypothetical protein [Muribaculaceae bacterium]